MVRDVTLIQQLLAFVPAQHLPAFFELATRDDVTKAEWQSTIRDALESLEGETQRRQLGQLLSRLLPLEALIPDIYQKWRPIVRDGVAFIGAHLSSARLAEKLADQVMLPADVPLEQRLMAFIAQMPSLQKLGQMIARNRNLAPTFRAELIRLENAVQDIAPDEIHAIIEHQLGERLRTYNVDMQDTPFAEASVSAAVRFTWLNPDTGKRERGVFKVLKPYVKAHLTEELNLLRSLADFLDLQPYREILSQAGLRELCNDICTHLAEEVNFPGEQANLVAASHQYACVSGVRVPGLIAALSTPAMTAMTEEQGVKITDAFLRAPKKRRRVATRLVQALLAMPFFAQAPEAILHADPHAGNLLCDEKTGDVVLVDWSLTECLSLEERRQLMLLMSAVCLRDTQRLYKALEALSTDDFRHDPSKASFVRRQVRHFLRQLSPYTFPSMVDVLPLIDRLILSGIGFSNSLVILGKILFTLKGVLHDLAPGVRITPVVMGYMLSQGQAMAHQHSELGKPAVGFRSPLSRGDWMTLSWSALGYSSRVWQQCAERVWASHPLSRMSTESG
jgi:ubiquinone biosynthesis protein